MSKNKHTDKTKTANAPVNQDNSSLHKVLWYFVLGFLIILVLNQFKNNSSSATKDSLVKATMHTLADRSYQEFYENKLLKKPFAINLKKYKNKYEYMLFEKINLEEAYAGKENYVFGESMTRAYFGDDYVGEEIIKEQVRKAKFVQTKLKELGVELLVLFAPGKNTIYSEFLPEYVLKTKKKPRNYETYLAECKNQNINIIDFVQLFTLLKPTTKYPLFPKYGSHWSYYAECKVVDTTIKKLEQLMNLNLPNIVYTDVTLKDTVLVRDGDILKKAQLDIPKGDSLAYPQSIGFEQGTSVQPQKIIGIGDSYFRGFYYLGALQHAFDNSQLWYYYNSIIPENTSNPEVWELDLKAEIMKTKAIVLLSNEMNLKNLGNGFIDDAYDLFSNPEKYYLKKKEKNKLNTIKKEIRTNKETLTQLTKKAQERGITIDSLITETAMSKIKASR